MDNIDYFNRKLKTENRKRYNNWRLQAHGYFRIMAATRHKTRNVFKGYNTVGKDELKALVEENR